jgi:hypothetical protein
MPHGGQGSQAATQAGTPFGGSAATLTIEADSRLIEDYLHTSEVLVDRSQPAPVAVYPNQQKLTEALVISPEGEVQHVSREPASDSGWNVCGLAAAPVSLAVADGPVVWAAGRNDPAVWQFHAGRWAHAPALPAGARAADVSAGTDRVMRVLTTDSRLFALPPGATAWQPVATPNVALGQAPVGASGNLWAVTSDKSQVVADTGGGWMSVVTPPEQRPGRMVAGADGSLWCLSAEGSLFQRSGGNWQPAHGPVLNAVAVVGADDVWGVELPYQNGVFIPRLWRRSGGSWQQLPNPPLPGYYLPQEIPGLFGDMKPAVLVASADGTVYLAAAAIWRFDRTTAGWQEVPGPTGMQGVTASGGVTDVAAGQDAQGNQHAFYIQAGTLYHARYAAGGWLPPVKLATGCSALGVTTQRDTGDLIAYAATGDGNLLVATASGPHGSWSARTVDAREQLRGATLQLSAQDANAWFTSAVIDGELCVGWGSAQAPLGTGDFGGYLWPVAEWTNGNPTTNVPSGLRQVVRLPWVQSEKNFYAAVVDGQGAVSLVYNIVNFGATTYGPSGAFGHYVRVSAPPLGSVTAVSGVIDGEGMARLYATDSNGRLWVIRQTGSGGPFDNPWSWTAWHPLGDHCTYLATGPAGQATMELYVLDSDHFLAELSQNPVARTWTYRQVAKPARAQDPPDYVAQYTTTVTVSDAVGNPQPGTAVTVTVDEPVSIWVAGAEYRLTAGTPCHLVTGRLGQLTLSTLAFGLHTPQLTFTAARVATPKAVYPPARAHQTLAAADATTLRNAAARTGGQPPDSHPLLPHPDTPNLGGAVTAIRDTFTVQQQAKIDGATVGAPGVRRFRGRPAGAPVGAADFWSELEQFGEDVFHAAGAGILAVTGVDVAVAARRLNVTLALQGLGTKVLSFVIDTIHDVVHALQTAFVWLEATVQKVVDWLKELFDWDDILNTHAVIAHFIDQLVMNAAASTGHVHDLLSRQFATLLDRLPEAFGNKSLGTSFSDHVAGQPHNPAVGRDPLHADGVQGAFGANRTQCTYAHGKTQAYVQQGGSFGPSGSPSAALLGTGPLDRFLARAAAALDMTNPESDFNRAVSQLREALLHGLSDPAGLFELGMSSVLGLMQAATQTVLKLARDVLLALVDEMGEAITALRQLLTAPLEIPVLSWLYQQKVGSPLTVLDLFSLLVAMPATILYKVLFGGPEASPPIPPGQVDTIVTTPLPWVRWAAAGPSPASRPVGAVQFPFSLELFALTTGTIAITDVLADAYATAEISPPDPAATMLSVLSIVAGAAGLAFSAPYDIFHKDMDEWSGGEQGVVMQWGASFAPWALNVLFTAGSSNRAIAEFSDPGGPPLLTLVGMFMLAVGLTEVLDHGGDPDFGPLDQALGIIAPVPVAGKAVLLAKNPTATGVLCVLDALCDLAAGALMIVSGSVRAAVHDADGDQP